MANYTFLRQGDKLPSVGVLQKLLNRGGAGLKADGDFGSRTKTAVQGFQRPRGLTADGAVGQASWPRLAAGANLPIVDCIDVFDPSLSALEERDIRRAGGTPIVLGGMSNGVEQAINTIVARSRNVFLLRFHGHGAKGDAGISTGRGDLDPNLEHRADIAIENFMEVRHIVRRLRSVFGPYGCIQFMHCETGGGSKGRRLLDLLAAEVGVPVSAGINTQFGGGLSTFRFEGPTYTAVPGGAALKGWSESRPDFAMVSVP
jgi:hypothetical protein